MKQKNIIKAFIFCLFVGTLLHFTYDLSGNIAFIGYFSAVNESIWEHTKLASYSILFYSIIFYIKNKGNFNNFFLGIFLSMSFSILTVPILFYSYYHFAKKSIFLLDILIFIIACLVASSTFIYIINLKKHFTILNFLSLIFILILIFYMAKWSFNPPPFPIFENLPNLGLNI